MQKNIVISESDAMQLSYEEKCDLLRNDPVMVVEYCENRFPSLFKLLTMKNIGIFEEHPITDWYTRVEFQKKGVCIGIVCFIMIRLLILKQKIRIQKTIAFHSLTGRISSEYMSEQEVRRLQEHRHTFTCYKKKREEKDL